VIRFVLALIVIMPATAWYALRMIWAVSLGRPNAPCVCDSAPRRWALLLLRVSGVDVMLENEDAIDPTRAQILVANHVSWYDVLALVAYLPGRTVFVAKKELEGVPLFGAAVRACGHVFIDRQDRMQAVESLESARERLKDQSPTIIMFPEGTRSRTGELQAFKKGAFVLAIQTGVEIVPAAISGSRDVMRKGSWLIRSGTIRVRFGEPIETEGLQLDQRNELTLRAHEALAALQSAP
jgi:1-acyl-sn-glycerol-3-phosphate acyltransferase